MTSHAYYNENDEFAAAWLRMLIDAGAVASGEVDTSSVVDGRQNGEQCGDYRRLGHWARHPAQSSMYGSPSSSCLILSISLPSCEYSMKHSAQRFLASTAEMLASCGHPG